jgi:hypothetical protein
LPTSKLVKAEDEAKGGGIVEEDIVAVETALYITTCDFEELVASFQKLESFSLSLHCDQSRFLGQNS